MGLPYPPFFKCMSIDFEVSGMLGDARPSDQHFLSILQTSGFILIILAAICLTISLTINAISNKITNGPKVE